MVHKCKVSVNSRMRRHDTVCSSTSSSNTIALIFQTLSECTDCSTQLGVLYPLCKLPSDLLHTLFDDLPLQQKGKRKQTKKPKNICIYIYIYLYINRTTSNTNSNKYWDTAAWKQLYTSVWENRAGILQPQNRTFMKICNYYTQTGELSGHARTILYMM